MLTDVEIILVITTMHEFLFYKNVGVTQMFCANFLNENCGKGIHRFNGSQAQLDTSKKFKKLCLNVFFIECNDLILTI